MNQENEIQEGFAEDHATQRRRRVRAGTRHEIEEQIQRVEERWRSEFLNTTDDLRTWKRKALTNTLKFPDPPRPPNRNQYQSVFLPLQFSSGLDDKVHLDDYSQFYSFIRNAAAYRLGERIAKPLDYPVLRPDMPTFPTSIKTLEPKKTNYFLFWEYPSQHKLYNEWIKELINDRELYWRTRKEEFERACCECLGQWEEAKSKWDVEVANDKAKLQQLRFQYETGSAKGVVDYFLPQLDSIPLPRWCPREYELQFDEAGGILLIECRLPYFGALEVVKTKELTSGPKLVPVNQREARDLTNRFPYLIALRLLWEIPQLDYCRRVGMVCCNGYVIYDDPATGRRRQDVILSVAAKREELESITLDRVEPEACFRSLRGVAAAKIWELVPVQPLIRFNKNDKRFIAGKEILDTLGNTNLATMDWQDFEHFIRELFEKEFGSGDAEVKVTQASRDRGVDAVVFDPEPLRGGRIIIQAKRYTNIVDVSAVRDLYGTVINEGANKGILVTTSNYGRDSYEFAKDKPLILINGQNLLHLLNKHGYKLKIDIKEAKQLLKLDPVDR